MPGAEYMMKSSILQLGSSSAGPTEREVGDPGLVTATQAEGVGEGEWLLEKGLCSLWVGALGNTGL